MLLGIEQSGSEGSSSSKSMHTGKELLTTRLILSAIQNYGERRHAQRQDDARRLLASADEQRHVREAELAQELDRLQMHGRDWSCTHRRRIPSHKAMQRQRAEQVERKKGKTYKTVRVVKQRDEDEKGNDEERVAEESTRHSQEGQTRSESHQVKAKLALVQQSRTKALK
eukprot:3337445-Pleurochrysis_carterae.AAC.8